MCRMKFKLFELLSVATRFVRSYGFAYRIKNVDYRR